MEEANIKSLTVKVCCSNCNNKTIFSQSVFVTHDKHFSTQEFDRKVLEKTPKKITCKKCNSKAHNVVGYTFYHHQNISQ